MKQGREPLTLEQLLDVQGRRIKDPDIRALLWEIKRLLGEVDLLKAREHHVERLRRALEERAAAPIRDVLHLSAPHGLLVSREDGGDHTLIRMSTENGCAGIKIDDRADRRTIAGQFWALSRQLDPGNDRDAPPASKKRRRSDEHDWTKGTG